MQQKDALVASCYAEVYTPSTENWEKIKSKIIQLEHDAFPHPYPDEELEDDFTTNDNIVVLLMDRRNDAIVGYMYTVPIDKWFPERKDAYDTMLIDNVVLAKAYRGHGLVGIMTTLLEKELRKNGYKKFEIRANIPNGYAEKIAKVYKERILQGPIRTNPAEDEAWGPRMIYIIKL